MEKGNGWLFSGLISGFIYGVLASIMQVLVTLAFKSQILAFLAQRVAENPSLFPNVTSADLFSLSISLIPMIAITGGILLGLVFAFIYSSLYGRVPGKTSISKGPYFGLGLWIILNVTIGLVDLPQFGVYYYISGITGGFVASIAYGYILAMLFAYERKA